MSNGTDNTTADTPTVEPTAAPTSTATLLEVLRENFTVVSGIAVVGGIGLATFFLSAYLSVFDWHLIWFVQYPDIVTFGLIAIGVIGSSVFLLQAIVQHLLSVGARTDRPDWIGLVILLVFSLIALGSQIYSEHLKAEPHYLHLTLGWATLLFGIAFVYFVAKTVRAGTWPTLSEMISLAFIALGSTIFFGQWLGYSVLESSQFAQDVSLKSETLSGAKLVIVLSRYTILLEDKLLYVVPTADIVKFQSAARH